MSDFELHENDDDPTCPKCGDLMRSESCAEIGCEDGQYLDEDGINGDSWERCSECRGTGRQEWCTNCGWDNVFKQYLNGKSEAA